MEEKRIRFSRRFLINLAEESFRYVVKKKSVLYFESNLLLPSKNNAKPFSFFLPYFCFSLPKIGVPVSLAKNLKVFDLNFL